MAKLRIQAPNGKTLLVDVGDADKSEYDDLATSAVDDYMSKQTSAPSIAEQNLASLEGKGPVDDLMRMSSDIGKDVKAGYAGIADLVSGNGLKKAASNVENVENDQEPTTQASYIGRAIGSQFTPIQIALQALMGKFAEAVGPWVMDVMKGWSEAAARMAIGTTKKIASAIGINDLSAVAKFLMTPISIGGKTFEPIVTATSSAEDMLAKANEIKAAAGKMLGTVSGSVDKAIASAPENEVALDLSGLKANLEALKAAVSNNTPNLGKAVISQYENAIKDVDELIDDALQGQTQKIFSSLSAMKTTIGDLVYRHGSPLESKAALNDVYHAISGTLEDAAKKVAGPTGESYMAANAIYNKITTIVEALEGKVISNASKSFFNDPAALIAGITAGASSGPAGLITGPLAFGATKVAEGYGPQAIAQGLQKGAPLVAGALKIGARGIPVIGNAIAQALSSNGE